MGRSVLHPPPDSEAVRLQLLQLLDAIDEEPEDEYPTPTRFDHELIRHLHVIREPRAVTGLVRILSFDPFRRSGDSMFSKNNVGTISCALEALGYIMGDSALAHIGPWVSRGLEDCGEPYDADGDRYAPLRYHAVRALWHMSGAAVMALLKQAMQDPHDEIRAFAIEIYRNIREREK